MKNGKRILSVTIETMFDGNGDPSWLGEYSNTKESDYSIDRAHTLDCASVNPSAEIGKGMLERASDHIQTGRIDSELDTPEDELLSEAMALLLDKADQITECDCGETGDMIRRFELRFFNPVFENYKGLPDADIRKYCLQDYERMEKLCVGDWNFIGINAAAEVLLTGNTIQRIQSGGIWGIESDSDDSFLQEQKQEQLSELKDQLLALGFSKRAIATAFKTVQEKES